MFGGSHIRYVKTAVMGMAAVLYVSLAADWCEPGIGLRQAAVALGFEDGVATPPVWGALVRWVGRDIAGLGTISLVSALVSLAFLLVAVGDLFARARQSAERGQVGARDFFGVEAAGVSLTACAFVFAPGFLDAATHVGPFMSLLVAPLLALLLLVRLAGGKRGRLVRLVKGNAVTVVCLLLLVAYALWTWIRSRDVVVGMLPSLAAFVVVGALPAAVSAGLVRRRWLVTQGRKLFVFGLWGLAVAALASIAFMGARQGGAASRVVAKILANAQGAVAIVADGALDDVFLFMVPKGLRLLQLTKNDDPEHGRELARWLTETYGRSRSADAGPVAHLDDLALAAELGPETLVDEWRKLDPVSCRRAVRTVADYFPSETSWLAACRELKGMRHDAPGGASLRRLLGRVGNEIGCRYLEGGKVDDAWRAFWEVLDYVSEENGAARANLLGMVERGHGVFSRDQERLKSLHDAFEQTYATPQLRLSAIRADGRLFGDVPPREEEGRENSSIRSSDGVDISERDALVVLRTDRRNFSAHAAVGRAAVLRGDYASAERHLRRALSAAAEKNAGTQDVSGLRNDLAFSLARLGRATEGEPLAREAVRSHPGSWQYRETLALCLVLAEKTDEARKELRTAVELAEKAGVRSAEVLRFDIDRAWLLCLEGAVARLRPHLRTLEADSRLTDLQRDELAEMAERSGLRTSADVQEGGVR